MSTEKEQEIRRNQLRRLQKRLNVVIGLYVGTVLVVLLLFAVRHWPSGSAHTPQAQQPQAADTPSGTPTVAVVNGEAILKPEVEYAMEVASAGPVVDRLVQETAILQEAKRENLNLDDPDSRQALVKLSEQIKDPELYNMREKTLKARLSLRKLLLKNVNSEEEHKVYDTFKDPLTLYEVFEYTSPNDEKAREALADLKSSGNFAAVVRKRAKDPRAIQQGGRVGFLTMARIEDLMGTPASDAITANLSAAKGGILVRASYGVMLVKIGKVLTSFIDLKPSIDNIIAEAHRVQLVYDLSKEVKIDYPILDANRKIEASISPHFIESSGSPAASGSPASGPHH